MINIKAFLGLNYYISELDQFLTHFDHTHPKLSTSQRLEKEKYARVYEMRDNPTYQESEEKFWDKF